MLKSIFKETIIILLLLLTIIVLLGVLFYDYIPIVKIIPEKVQEYALEEDIQKEIEKEVKNDKYEAVVKTYQLDAIDMEQHEETNDYNKGKINPFKKYSNGTGNSDNTNNSNDTNESNNTDNIDKEDPSKDNFLDSVGK